MKTTKEIMKKAICLIMSILILTSSLPTQSFAQEKKSRFPKGLKFTMAELFEEGTTTPTNTLNKLIEEGYVKKMGDYVNINDMYKVIDLNGGERLETFGLIGTAEKGDKLLLSLDGDLKRKKGILLSSKEMFGKNYRPIANMPGYVAKVFSDGEIETPLYELMEPMQIDEKFYLRSAVIDARNHSINKNKYDKFRTTYHGHGYRRTRYFQIKEGMEADIFREYIHPPVTVNQLEELIKESGTDTQPKRRGRPKKEVVYKGEEFTFTMDELFEEGSTTPTNTFNKLIEEGYVKKMGDYIYIDDIYKVIDLSGDERLETFGLTGSAKKGDKLLLSFKNDFRYKNPIILLSEEMLKKHYKPVPYMSEGCVARIFPDGGIETPLYKLMGPMQIDETVYLRNAVIDARNHNIRHKNIKLKPEYRGHVRTRYFQIKEGMEEDILKEYELPSVTEEQVTEILKESTQPKKGRGLQKKEVYKGEEFTFTMAEFFEEGSTTPTNTFNKLIEEGYVKKIGDYVNIDDVYKVIDLNGDERLETFGLTGSAKKGDKLLLPLKNDFRYKTQIILQSEEMFKKHYKPVPYMPEGCVAKVFSDGRIETPLYELTVPMKIDGKLYSIYPVIDARNHSIHKDKYGKLRPVHKGKRRTRYFQIKEGMGADILKEYELPSVTEEQVTEILKQPAQPKGNGGLPKKEVYKAEELKFTMDELFEEGSTTPTKTFNKLIEEGYVKKMGDYINIIDIYKVIDLNGDEQLETFGLTGSAKKGDKLLLPFKHDFNHKKPIILRSEEMFEKNYRPIPHMPEGYVAKVFSDGRIENPLYDLMVPMQINGKFYPKHAVIDPRRHGTKDKYNKLRCATDQGKKSTRYFEIKEGMEADILKEYRLFPVTENQVAEHIKESKINTQPKGKPGRTNELKFTMDELFEEGSTTPTKTFNKLIEEGYVKKMGDYVHINDIYKVIDLSDDERLEALGLTGAAEKKDKLLLPYKSDFQYTKPIILRSEEMLERNYKAVPNMPGCVARVFSDGGIETPLYELMVPMRIDGRFYLRNAVIDARNHSIVINKTVKLQPSTLRGIRSTRYFEIKEGMEADILKEYRLLSVTDNQVVELIKKYGIETQPKRGRDRPRENPIVESGTNTQPKRPVDRPKKEGTTQSPVQEKKGRGRPRKEVITQSPVQEKRGRGRPRKEVITQSPVQEKRPVGRPSIRGLKEGLPRVTAPELFGEKGNISPTETLKMLEEKGYIQKEGIFVDARDIYKVIEFGGGEDLRKFGLKSGLAQEGDKLLLSLTGERMRVIRKEEIGNRFIQVPHMSEGYVIEVKPDGKFENPLYRVIYDIEVAKDGKTIKYTRNSGINYGTHSVSSLFNQLRGGRQDNPVYYYEIKEWMGEEILRIFKTPAALNEKQLAELIKYDVDGKLFSSSGLTYTEETVQAVRAKGGEKPNKILPDGKLGPSDEIAKAGDWIITYSNGSESIVNDATFVDEYQKLPELGDNYFKVMKKVRLVALKQPMRVKLDDGIIRELKPWDVLEMTPERIIVSDVSLNSGELLFREVYRKTFQDLNNFMEHIYKALGPEEQKLFKTFVEREVETTKGLIRKEFAEILEKGAVRNIAKEAGEEVGEEITEKAAVKRAAGAVGKSVPVVGVLLYFAFTAMSAPKAQAAQNSNYVTRAELLAKEKQETAEILSKAAYFTNPDLEEEIIQNAVEGDGILLEEMAKVMPAIREKGITEDKAVQVLKSFIAQSNKKAAAEHLDEVIINGVQHKPYSAPYIPDILP